MKISQVAKETLKKGGVVIIRCVDCGQSEKPSICFIITNDKSALRIRIRSFKLKGKIMHQSIPVVPITPPGNRGAFAYVGSPGDWALAYPRATPGHLTNVFLKDG